MPDMWRQEIPVSRAKLDLRAEYATESAVHCPNRIKRRKQYLFFHHRVLKLSF
jgi:hypothetical protein